MKKVFILFIVAVLFSPVVRSQADTYFTSGGEMIFSFANLEYDATDVSLNNIMRWAPVFNIQGMYNVDFSDNFGLYTGLAIRNVGYIVDDWPSTDNGTPITVKKKFRTYNLGLPLGLKIGNMDKFFIYGGYEIEFPFHYKEKTFQDEQKDKFTVWFSDRVEQFQHGFMVGIQLPWGSNIKFKYYLSEFHNQSYTESSGNMPYNGLQTNIFYFSLNYNLFKNTDFYHSDKDKKEYY
jgi:hypothetical protein